ncbi:MAG: 16S rRNA (guanine(527)-N(7))-methyltransferase RsmG [Iphinoe sp. HA4291-MV1]|nr:16S rRNA (guanine(527)-N(7))-methyltransferase RsmG [Iphinoe sp. HA4291-MV1]
MANTWQQTLHWTPTVQQQVQFQRLYEFILEGNRQLNLTRITDPQEFWEKHLWDSLRGIAPLLRDEGDEEWAMGNGQWAMGKTIQNHRRLDRRKPPLQLLSKFKVQNLESPPASPASPLPPIPRGDPESPLPLCSSASLSFIDIGTGAGFPGIPIAIAVANSTVTLLDSTRKKISFIEKIRSALDLTNIKTLTGRSEEIGQQPQHRQTYDVALIRAVGTASVCAEYALPLLKQGGLAVIYRGNWTEEETKSLENAVNQLGGVIELVDKFTTPLSGSIRHCLFLRKVGTTPIQFPRPVGVPTQKPL